MGQEDLKSDKYLNLEANFDLKQSKEEGPTYESTPDKIDWKQEVFNEPRALTIKNFRDLFFGMMNQSRAQQRVSQAEEHVRQLYIKCQELSMRGNLLDAKIKATKTELNEQHNTFYDEFKQTMADHDERHTALAKKVRQNSDQLDSHSKMHEEMKMFREATIRGMDKQEKAILYNKKMAHEDMNKVKEEIVATKEELEKNLGDANELNQQRHTDGKQQFRQELAALRDELQMGQKSELEKLNSNVMAIVQKVNTNNDGIYEKFDEKLRKIKDVCAQYFSKYEKHLINHQTIVKDLERQQEQWVKMLIQPQELNQARLYAVETRIKEGEGNKLRDVDFLKETMKKLIYAIE
jgi:hypothetical protein